MSEEDYGLLFSDNDREADLRTRELYEFIPMPIMRDSREVQFDQLLNGSFLLFGERGYGGTRHRHEVARRIREQMGSDGSISLCIERESLPKPVFKVLFRELTREAISKLKLLNISPNQTIDLYAFHTALDGGIRRSFSDTENEAYKEKLRRFRNAIREDSNFNTYWKIFNDIFFNQDHRSRLSAIIIIVDFNSKSDTSYRSNREPLNDVCDYFHGRNRFVKCFLHISWRQHFQSRSPLPCYVLNWNDPDEYIDRLVKMLAARLSRHLISPGDNRAENSRGVLVSSFGALLCSDELSNIDERIARAAQGSPRMLFVLAKQIIEEHCRDLTDANKKISEDTINNVLKQHEQS
ncbi:hypothetical protein HC928_07055 [bacterium]|nr:hypothetical protein [bacterium]